MLSSNLPLQRVSERSVPQEMLSGAVTGAISAGVMQAGFYGLSKLKSSNPILQNAQRYSKAGYKHGYGSFKRTAATYGTAMLVDGLIHGATSKTGL